MPQLAIHFTEGFKGHSATLSIEGRELLREADLTTDLRTGLAKIARIEVPNGRSVLTVEVPAKNYRATLSIDPTPIKYVEVSLAGGGLKFVQITLAEYEREPRGYM
jgi:hypothetical protein